MSLWFKRSLHILYIFTKRSEFRAYLQYSFFKMKITLPYNQFQRYLWAHQRTDKPNVVHRLWRECPFDNSIEGLVPLSRNSYRACFYGGPIIGRPPWSRPIWRRPFLGSSIWCIGDSIRGLAVILIETPRGTWWSPPDFSALRHPVHPLSVSWLFSIFWVGSLIRACMIVRRWRCL